MALAGHDVEWLFGEIAHAARRGKPLADVVGELALAEKGTRRGRAAERLAQRLAEGKSLSAAVAAAERDYPPGSAAAIEAGEMSGRLPESLTAMAESATIEDTLRHRISLTFLYPLIMAVACSAIMVFLQIAFIPPFQQTFQELNVELPYVTRIMPMLVITVSTVGVFIPAGVLALLFLVTVPWLMGRSVIDHLRFAAPLVSRPIRHVLLSRWCATAGPLFAAGVPEGRAVRIAGESTGNRATWRLSKRMSAEIESGVPLPQAMMKEPFFPPVLSWMVGASAAAGGHRDLWPLVREIYRDHAQTETATISVALSFGFMCITLTLVILSAVAVILPIVKLMCCLGG